MPLAPKTYRPAGYKQREKGWASRQTDYRGWYQRPEWKGPGGIREQVIVRDLFQCQECKRKGKMTFVALHCERGDERTAHVDHKVAHDGDWERFCDIDGCETLCASCHSEKTARQDGGMGR